MFRRCKGSHFVTYRNMGPNSQLHLFIKNITKMGLRVAGPVNLEKSKGEKL
jgi:hypothetical protein